jgi:hypothetical protein
VDKPIDKSTPYRRRPSYLISRSDQAEEISNTDKLNRHYAGFASIESADNAAHFL